MPRPRIGMRKIREVLRLALGEGLSQRQASAASGVPLTTAGDLPAPGGVAVRVPGPPGAAVARQQVDVRLSAATVEVFRRSRRVASHPRSRARHGHATDPAHMPGSHRRHAEWTPGGSPAGRARPARPPQDWSPGSWSPGRTPSRATGPRWASSAWPAATARAEAACARALALRSCSYRSVEPTLRSGLDRQPLHASTSVTETVYRHQLKPVITKGAETMNTIFTDRAETRSA